jgi:ribonuclease Z
VSGAGKTPIFSSTRLRWRGLKDASIQRIVGHHTSPYDCGRVFAQTRPKLAAFTHVVQLTSPAVPPPTLDELVTEVRKTYDGPLQIGEDLMSFEIGDTVTVKRLMPRV